MENRMYALTEAADVADVPLDELRRAIQDGLLAVRRSPSTGDYHVAADDLTPSKAVPEEVLAAVHEQRAEHRSPIVAYYAATDEALDPAVKDRLRTLAPDQAISKTQGLRALTILCLRALGLEPTTRIFRLHG